MCRRVWSDMKRRCEDPKYKDRNKYYKDCTLCKEWQNYSNFARWFYRNYYEIDGEVVELDKDIYGSIYDEIKNELENDKHLV